MKKLLIITALIMPCLALANKHFNVVVDNETGKVVNLKVMDEGQGDSDCDDNDYLKVVTPGIHTICHPSVAEGMTACLPFNIDNPCSGYEFSFNSPGDSGYNSAGYHLSASPYYETKHKWTNIAWHTFNLAKDNFTASAYHNEATLTITLNKKN